ncbi:MAG: FMN-binding protein [Spirochaetales bacterium]|nr:FMN-binding protein [Spirochaetales bacterium]
MKTVATTGLKLFAICAVAALALGAVNAITEPRIAEYKVETLRAALAELTPGSETGEPEEVPGNPVVVTRYPVLTDGQEAGALLELVGTGYGGDMKILARYDASGEIRAVKLMEDEETPGLGKKAENPAYMQKFIGTGTADKPVPVRKEMLPADEADAITGATMTFLGVSKALAEGAEFVRQGR